MLTTTGLSVGNHSFTAEYLGDANNQPSSSAASAYTVNEASMSVMLAGTGSPTVAGQNVTFTATVNVTGSGSGTPTSNVTFMDGAVTIGTAGLVGGLASFTTSTLSVAGHNITATYNGDTNFSASPVSNTVAQTVNPDNTTITLVSSGSPTVFGQAVGFTVSVTAAAPGAGTPTGTVTLTNNGNPLTTLNLAGGAATFTTTALPSSSGSIVATYNGDPSFNASAPSAPATQQINPAGTTAALLSSSNPGFAGQGVTFTAIVSVLAPGAGTPGGTVTFLDGGTSIGTGILSGGVANFTTTALALGSHTITASYGATANFAGSTSAGLAETVTTPSTTTTTAPTTTRPSVPASNQIIAVGTDAGVTAQVNVYNAASGALEFSFQPFGSFAGGARVAVGDVNGDGTPDIVVGGGPEVVVYDRRTLAVLQSFNAFGVPSFGGGVYVAAGDVNGDGKADIICGADAGGGPQVAVYNSLTSAQLASFYAFSPTFTGGVRVAAVDVSGTGHAEVLAGARPSGSPQVTAFDGATLQLLSSFFAYAPQFSQGVFVAG